MVPQGAEVLPAVPDLGNGSEMPFCIHIHRNPLEVAHSLKVRNGVPIRVGLALWELYNRLALKASHGLPRHIVSYAELLDNPTATVGTIHEALRQYGAYDLRAPGTRELAAFLDQGLRHHRRELKSFRPWRPRANWICMAHSTTQTDSSKSPLPQYPRRPSIRSQAMRPTSTSARASNSGGQVTSAAANPT